MRYAVHFAVLAMSAAFACATPTEYRDGPMVRPEPVRTVPGYTPPGTGLPEYMPMPEPPQYPRSPHKRYLPPEKDGAPGIWASDEPKAGKGRLPDLLDVVFPLPDGVEPEDVPALKTCSDLYSALFRNIGDVFARAMRSDPQERSCLAYALLGDCMYRENAAHHGATPEAVLRRIDALFKQCYPHAGAYGPIIRDVEAARNRPMPPSKKGDH